MKIFHHKHHFFGHTHHRKIRHRLVVLVTAGVVLFGGASAIGIYFGMDGFAMFPFAILFLLVGGVAHIAIDHY